VDAGDEDDSRRKKRFLSCVWWTRTRDRRRAVAIRISSHFPFLQQRLRGSEPRWKRTATTKGSEGSILCLFNSLKSLVGLFRPNLHRRHPRKNLESGRDPTITMRRRGNLNLLRSTSISSWTPSTILRRKSTKAKNRQVCLRASRTTNLLPFHRQRLLR